MSFAAHSDFDFHKCVKCRIFRRRQRRKLCSPSGLPLSAEQRRWRRSRCRRWRCDEHELCGQCVMYRNVHLEGVCVCVCVLHILVWANVNTCMHMYVNTYPCINTYICMFICIAVCNLHFELPPHVERRATDKKKTKRVTCQRNANSNGSSQIFSKIHLILYVCLCCVCVCVWIASC